MTLIQAVARAVALACVLAVAAIAIGGWLAVRNGFSARDQPTALEAAVATRVRAWGVPAAARARANPVSRTPEVLEEALEHYADHCASCHANDGSGNTAMGRNLFPKAPDMRLAATQDKSDGELFHAIEEGVRFTGMPAWAQGTPDGERASWALVHFIRHLPRLSPAELEKMAGLNPRNPREVFEEAEMQRFLEGEDAEPAPPAPAPHRHTP